MNIADSGEFTLYVKIAEYLLLQWPVYGQSRLRWSLGNNTLVVAIQHWQDSAYKQQNYAGSKDKDVEYHPTGTGIICRNLDSTTMC